ncbi:MULTISPECIES: SDR family oxidoreductase [unclassified Curtobacterium]|uniref:SDR family oxidoreductase n=1 Tax=unclassified Curtobacterium TaxID=257496 RepID=UPI000D9BB841|nr:MULTISPECIES: SDR family oxidoreductase [unclassified Curtobacterium]PYY32496.1 oxidoreductase [Curtobacterium sp. MCBD17_030]PZE86874.1 oxidoreductase [Curtobacterium sp. MCBD17_032]
MEYYEGKVAVVTGGARGIGATIAKKLAGYGMHVAFSYVQSASAAEEVVEAIQQLGRKARAYRADQGDPESVSAFIRSAADDFGHINVLVNSAGVFTTGTVDSGAIDQQASDRQIDVNYRGAVATVKAASSHIVDGGRIIAIGTSAAYKPLISPGLGEYVATKAALAAFAKGAALDLAGRGITVNIVEPGPIDTDMNPDGTDSASAMKARVPLGRYGTADEVSELVAYLAGPHASFITGSQIIIDGGLTA